VAAAGATQLKNAAPVLSVQQARQLHLAAQGLNTPMPKHAQPLDLLAAIERMRLLQIDTISVVARSPYLVLYSRIGAYPQLWLEQALAQTELIETWAHEACFAPVGSYPQHCAHQDTRRHWSKTMAQRALDADGQAIEHLVARIAQHAALRSSDFTRTEPSAGWWGWKPEKRWLEAAFVNGTLMVARREGFQRVYDVPQRVLASRPDLLCAARPTAAALRQQLIVESLIALGIASATWLADYFRLSGRVGAADLQPLLASGVITQVAVRGWAEPLFVHQQHAELLERVRAGTLRLHRTALLSPFDPVVWDRQRTRELFDFDYRLECYTPAVKRQYGYFVLPILDRDQLVGRLDAKAHRAQGVFEIKSLYLQPGTRPSVALAGRLAKAIAACAAWHETPRVQLTSIESAQLAPLLRAALA
jgi:hypothetical protein